MTSWVSRVADVFGEEDRGYVGLELRICLVLRGIKIDVGERSSHHNHVLMDRSYHIFPIITTPQKRKDIKRKDSIYEMSLNLMI